MLQDVNGDWVANMSTVCEISHKKFGLKNKFLLSVEVHFHMWNFFLIQIVRIIFHDDLKNV